MGYMIAGAMIMLIGIVMGFMLSFVNTEEPSDQ